MRIADGAFRLTERMPKRLPNVAVDILLESLAKEYGSGAVGVILSGAASDGVKGLAAIKAAGGITIVQDPNTAEYRSMPASAVTAGVADYVLPVGEIAKEIARLAKHPYVKHPVPEEEIEQVPDQGALEEILSRVRHASGLDLDGYKRATLLRRIDRRAALRHCADLDCYLAVLDGDPLEGGRLFDDILIRVTSFFRDPEMFEALSRDVLPELVGNKPPADPLRVWVPGVATGQEAYSMAIVIREYLEAQGDTRTAQIFASDLREGDLETARRGLYPFEIEAEMTPARLSRFFTKTENGYVVTPTIREMCVFARHDVTADPPFAALDLITCRNVLIYLGPSLQRRLFAFFHYALVDQGVLVLGKAEGVSSAPDLFNPTKHGSIFGRARTETPTPLFGTFASARPRSHTIAAPPRASVDRSPALEGIQGQMDSLLLDRLSPAAILVDSDFRILQFRGNAGDYIRPGSGIASLDLDAMSPEGLSAAIRAAAEEAVSTQAAARRRGLHVESAGGYRELSVLVIPMAMAGRRPYFAVLFDEASNDAHAEELSPEEAASQEEAEYLRQELLAASERIRLLTYGRDSANEELRAANEEIMSSNEELQSVNEELETAKEELQSTNEELMTLNEELRARNTEASRINEDLGNLLSSVRIPIVMLGSDLAIRRYTPQATEMLNIIPADIGRPILDITSSLGISDLEKVLTDVLQSGRPYERELIDKSGSWRHLEVRPYLRSEGAADGVVLALFDIDSLKKTQERLEEVGRLSEALTHVIENAERARDVDETAHAALAVVARAFGAKQGDVWLQVNEEWRRLAALPDDFDSPPPDAAGSSTASLVTGLQLEDDIRGFLRLFEIGHGRDLSPAERGFGRKLSSALALVLERARESERMAEMVRSRTEALDQTILELQQASHVKDLFLANMSHELRTPLNSIIGFSSVMLDGMTGELNEEQARQLGMVLGSGRHLLQLVEDILDLSKIEAGAMPVCVTEFPISKVLDAVMGVLEPLAETKGIRLTSDGQCEPKTIRTDELKLRQILLNLVSNAVKYTDEGEIGVSCRRDDGHVEFVVTDTGRGMSAEEIRIAFEEFRQVESARIEKPSGAGLGLAIAQRLARLLGGEVTVESEPGTGSTFCLTVPELPV